MAVVVGGENDWALDFVESVKPDHGGIGDHCHHRPHHPFNNGRPGDASRVAASPLSVVVGTQGAPVCGRGDPLRDRSGPKGESQSGKPGPGTLHLE